MLLCFDRRFLVRAVVVQALLIQSGGLAPPRGVRAAALGGLDRACDLFGASLSARLEALHVALKSIEVAAEEAVLQQIVFHEKENEEGAEEANGLRGNKSG